jgi:hypothetical protein
VRVVDEREPPREAAGEVAGLVDVVEVRRRDPPVRDDRRRELEAEEAPDGERLA